ncbi:Hpt domain-containing protein [Ferrigenium sp. UT5]|uniref:Hpt domain-containing protein n=1 Tax=Ferrigenium sp. UT5 TaxID=3242105 RepID=UPI00354D5B73
MSTSFNPQLLLPVKSELDRSLAAIIRDSQTFFAAPTGSPEALERARNELHRAKGVLQMLNLHGLVAFCAEVEILLGELAADPAQATPMHQDAVQHALFGLTHYLDALAGGAPNATLRLFPEYQELHQVRGLEMAFEVDLFFPELGVQLPPAILESAPPADAGARIKQARMHFQQGLLKWLRQENPGEALRAMRGALAIVSLCSDPAQRSFWWVAQGLLDCVSLDGVPPDLNIKKSFSRIDQRMRSLVEGSTFDEVAALSELLYLIARSHTVSETVEQIKQRFDLDTYLPEAPPLPPGEMAALLDHLRAQLAATNESWEQCVLNDRAACARFAHLTEQLLQLADPLDRNTLQFLCTQIHATAANIETPEHAQPVAMDMAMALLLLGSGIEHYQHLGSGFHEQARIVAMRLQQALLQRPEDTGKLSSLVALYCEMEQREIMAPLAAEMQSNLQQIEQTLNAFFGNAAKRTELLQVGRMLSQVQGGLHILSLEVAEQLLVALRHSIERYQQGDTPSVTEMRAVAAALSAADDYVQRLRMGQQPDPVALSAALHELEQAAGRQATESAVPEEEAAASVVSVRTGDEDAELLEVFLEEAQEVMETLRANLEIGRLHLDSREPWVIMRRSFHTLKGSGRMVGLNELGEVAWAVERAMNKWLATEQPATPELLEMVGDAEVLFQHWVEMLKSGSTTARIDTSHLLTAADCIEHDKPLPAPVHPHQATSEQAVPATIEREVAATEPVSPPPAAEEPPVVIGTVSLSPMLFRIASEEAVEHARALRARLEELQDTVSPVISHSFMRAAHTLAGVNRTLGFLPVAELAFALENWLEPRIDKPGAVGTPQLVLLDDVISALERLCAGIRNLEAPAEQTQLIARLAEDKSLAVPNVPVEQEEPALEAPVAEIAEPDTAASAAVAPSVPQQPRHVHDEVDEQLLPIFLEEAHDLYPQIGSTLRAWRATPDDAQLGRTLQRSLHTLKGSARMAGAMRLGELTHRVEDRVNKAITQHELNDALWGELDNYLDRIAQAIDHLTTPQPVEPVAAGLAAEAEVAPAPVAVAALEVGAERAMQAALLRVRSDTVDRLVNAAGEVSVTRARVEAELREFRSGILELTDSVTRLRKQLREVEIQAESQMQARVAASGESESHFDPLEFDRFTRLQELTRFMNESVHDVQTVQQSLLKNLDETTAALNAQGRLNRDLQQDLMSVRMVPFSSISERLYRIVRQTGKELGKRANLELSGAEIELDRSVLEKMTAPFEHLLRNALAHGLEMPEQRTRNGKTPIGEITLSLRQESNEVVFELADDGAGLDLARIRQKAQEKNLISADESLSDDQLIQLIFTAGLSTAGEVSEIAGRGVGLDVVRSEVSALGGRIDLASQPGQGVHFTIHLPLTLAVTRTLMVRAAQSVYALPSSMVEHVQQVKPAELDALYAQQHVMWQDKRYPLFYLPRVLGNDQAEIISQPHNPILFLRSGEQRIALHVDELLGNQEVVVKNIGPQLARLPGIAGATVSTSGDVILIINPVAFTQRIAVARKIIRPESVSEAVHHKPLVMVVDDSLTVRKITTRLLERSGYQVVTAKDGVDALEQLMEISPDAMLLDIEMPRMDGFEVAKRLRQDSKTRNLPIIMITSRTADKHRNYALELGVNEYLGKPYQEEALLGHLARFIQKQPA